jgi:hypothetical protein
MFLVFSDSPATAQAAAIFIHNDTLNKQRRSLSKPISSSVDFMVIGNCGAAKCQDTFGKLSKYSYLFTIHHPKLFNIPLKSMITMLGERKRWKFRQKALILSNMTKALAHFP